MCDEERRLVSQLAARDDSAWESSCRRYAGPLLGVVRLRFGCSQDQAEEIVHLTFIRCVKAITTFDPARGGLFPWLKAIVGRYQTYQWYDELVKWICTTFRTNPITKVELGQPFANPQKVNRRMGLPTLPYTLTLKDGSVLRGNLPFQYCFEDGKGTWLALHGLDWHLA